MTISRFITREKEREQRKKKKLEKNRFISRERKRITDLQKKKERERFVFFVINEASRELSGSSSNNDKSRALLKV